MTMFEFMKNAFFLLCGVTCIAAAVLVVYVALTAIVQSMRKGKRQNGKSRN